MKKLAGHLLCREVLVREEFRYTYKTETHMQLWQTLTIVETSPRSCRTIPLCFFSLKTDSPLGLPSHTEAGAWTRSFKGEQGHENTAVYKTDRCLFQDSSQDMGSMINHFQVFLPAIQMSVSALSIRPAGESRPFVCVNATSKQLALLAPSASLFSGAREQVFRCFPVTVGTQCG